MKELLRKLYRYLFVDDSVFSVKNTDIIEPFIGSQPVEVNVVPREPLKVNITSPKERKDLSYLVTKAHEVPVNYGSFYRYGPEIGDKVWFYTVNTIGVPISHPVIGDKVIPGKKPGTRYSTWASLPEVVRFATYNIDTADMLPVFTDGKVVAQDIISPYNPSKTSVDTDLSQKGLFWSLSNPPRESEIATAEKTLKIYYKSLLQKAGALSRVMKPSHLLAQITEEYHAAADYFKVRTIWHPLLEDDVTELRTKLKDDSGE